ncbi:stress-induced-phosphoprotein 1-like [Scophthalmus maximus]|uniref:stress-induced-phosphoprotein 1-like n=1 Tax=Scophthalmus maximus TaxID=52904 RepID=UPI001FA831CD|nr:stress-induced-phosphoprotein 1-like [Scophthalmus maximus]
MKPEESVVPSCSDPMKSTRDICRLLGFGGSDKELEAQDGASDPADRRKGVDSSGATVNNEEGLDDEERARRRAERRRAKRKRQKERRKLEREENMEEAIEQKEEEEEVAGVESESDSAEEYKEVERRNRNNRQLPRRTTSEEEPEWDVRSAFVANAASHIKLKGLKSRAPLITREEKENNGQSSQGENIEEMKRRGEALTEEGIEMFGQGQYSEAVDMFTEAIHCDPKDHRFYGNRSYCYWCLEQFSSALRDAQRSIELAPDWPKGHFRKGCALMGLKRYSEAEKSMEQVLNLDQHIKEASSRLVTCRILQLTELGFEEEQSKLLLEKFHTVQGVLTSAGVKARKQTSPQDQSGSCRSLWVGNITLEVTEKDLWDLFTMFGEIESIRVLHERFCAFVNFKNANVAARALEKLQGVELASTKLVMRYPDRWIQQRTNTGLCLGTAATQQSSASTGSRRSAPANGDGCVHGDECRFRHVPDRQGRGKKPWQP